MILTRINRLIDRVECLLSVLLLGGITLVMSYQVVMRYFFQDPPTWTQELSMLMLIYLSYIAADIVYRRRGHIGIDYFVGLLGPSARLVVRLFVNASLAVFFGVIFYHSVILLRVQATHHIAAVIPLSKMYWILPVSLTFPSMLLTTASFIRDDIQTIGREGKAHV